MSASAVKRWGRWFAFAWLGMWLSTALLPCCEVAAAVVRHEQALHPDCGDPAEPARDSGGKHNTGACVGIAAPAAAAAEGAAVPNGSKPAPPAPVNFESFLMFSALPALPLPVAYRAAPPPIAVYLRSQRLLI